MYKKTLSACIRESLTAGEMSPDLPSVLLTPSKGQVNQKDETEYWDYKESLEVGNPNELASLAKWILGFHNSKGGALIIGVTNDYKVIGIHENKIADTAMLKNKIAKYIGNDVSIFQGRIDTTNSGRYIWVIFIPKRTDPPVPVMADGPIGKDNKPIIRKNQYYVRIQDEVRVCVSPNDFERLFSGVSFKHLEAYSYEVDEVYYRLLAPHHDEFVGRNELLDQVRQALDSRSYIVSLDGVGGVGKSALAIEIVRRLYKAKKYQFIVSLSAKNRVWHQHTEARQAGFSGYTELLTELAKVLGIETKGKSITILRDDLVEFMRNVEGLLLIDNIEEIQDTAVFDFLKDDIPEPVKILVTSRISRDLGARTISVPEMSKEEALTLFRHELERERYYQYVNETNEMQEIIQATGCLPLAIKWAASLVSNNNSLRQVSSQLRGGDANKREFLEFCFTTMYDGLSDLARDAATLCPYLGDDWNALTLSIALQQPVSYVEKAIDELEDRGILLASTVRREGSFSVLPLTMDFLSSKWHQNKAFREKIMSVIANAVTTVDHGGNIFSLPNEERVQILYRKALELEARLEYEESLKFVKLALQWSSNEADFPRLGFLEGRLIYKNGDKHDGIARMQSALDQVPSTTRELADENMFLAQAILFHGRSNQEPFALTLIIANIARSTNVTQHIIEEFAARTLKQNNYKLIADLMENVKQRQHAYWVAKTISPYLADQQLIHIFGSALVDVLKLAIAADQTTDSERKLFTTQANEVAHILDKVSKGGEKKK